MLLPTYKEPRCMCFICVFVCVQSHRERPVWSEARLRGHTKDSCDATEASFSEPRKHHPGLQAELTPEPILQLPAPPSLPFSLSLSCLFPPLSFLKCTSLQLSHPWLPHRGTSVRAAAKWPALCFILLVVRFCFCL